MEENVLLVDDNTELLDSYRRYFYKIFNLSTASSPSEGLVLLKERQFMVVVSDLKMPQMDGIRFLSLAKEISPDTTRIMLTGYADVKNAIDAVNQGHIYRFLTKPSPPEDIERTIRSGIEYYRLVTAERVLLEQTLNGSISMMVEILSLVNPTAFSRSARIKKNVTTIVTKLKISPAWVFELAATLSQIGFVTLPPILLEKIYQQNNLTEQEQQMVNSHPLTARRLIEKIPRLEVIVPMIADQLKPFANYSRNSPETLPSDTASLGSQILKVAIEYDNLSAGGYTHSEIMHTMLQRKGSYNPIILSSLGEIGINIPASDRAKVHVVGLEIGMIVDEDITTTDHMLLLRKGQEITETVLLRLRNIHINSRVREPFYVLVPRRS